MIYTGTTKKDIVQQVANNKNLVREIKNIVKKEWADDLFQDVCLQLLEDKNDKKIIRLANNGQLHFYIFSIIKKQSKSNRSNNKKNIYQNKSLLYMDELIVLNSSEEEDEKINWDIDWDQEIKEEIQKLDWYSKKIVELYFYQKKSFSKLEEELNISRNSLFNTIKNAKNKIRNNLKKKFEI